MNEVLTYDDVLLVPQYSNIRSRKEIDISTDLRNNLKLDLPIISSPMDTITEDDMASSMFYAGGAGIIHRYNTIDEQAKLVTSAFRRGAMNVGAAIGITGDYVERSHAVLEHGASFICVDVAHGHHILMEKALAKLRFEFGDNLHIMAGNVVGLEGANDLADWGANSVRCNIGGGSICSTRIQTGHGLPGLQTIIDCAKTDRNIAVIADGGIKNSGDIVKALAAGADAVLIGSLLAATNATPGEIINQKGDKYKIYRGMASKEAQIDWKGDYSSFEGVSMFMPYRGNVTDILDDLERGIRSGFSYSGARTLKELRAKAKFVRQTVAGLSESGAHITTRKW